MVEITCYKCERCGKIYEDEELARKCEDEHTFFEKLEEEIYDTHHIYPAALIVTMNNEKKVRYKFESEVWE